MKNNETDIITDETLGNNNDAAMHVLDNNDRIQCIGRISNVQKSIFTIIYMNKEISARCKGSLMYGKVSDSDERYPVVGDYVKFDYEEHGDSRITSACKRKSVLKRPYPKDHSIRNSQEQIMVANADYCFIVTSLNSNYNLNRIVRYCAIAKQGNVEPVVVLTKSDLCDDADKYVEQVKKEIDKVAVLAVSSYNGEGIDKLREYMKTGVSIVLLGSSGVGKSTLINALSGYELMKTGNVRESDQKGRHTTTTRKLFVTDDGVTIIDTPGMRELGLCDVESGLDDTFSDIVELERSCKFRNCAHKTEPGCMVKAAIQNGELSERRFKMYMDMKNESERNFDRKKVALKRKEIKRRR